MIKHEEVDRENFGMAICKRTNNKSYLVETLNSEFLRLTPLFDGEAFERSIEDYYRTVNRFNTQTK